MVDEAGIKDMVAQIGASCLEGDAHVKGGDFCSAVRAYEAGLAAAGSLEGLRLEVLRLPGGAGIWLALSRELRGRQLLMLTRLASCHLSGRSPGQPASDPGKALEACERGLRLDPRCCKALFCKGQALARLGRHAEAEAALAGALDLEPGNAAIRRQLDLVRAWLRKMQPNEPPGTGGAQHAAPPHAQADEQGSATPGSAGGVADAAFNLPSPLVVLGEQTIEEMADRVAATLEASGIAAYGRELLRLFEYVVERQYGPGAGRRITRLVSCAKMIANRDTAREHRPGKGQRWLNCCIDGVSPDEPFHDARDHPWLGELARQRGALLRELKARAGDGHWEASRLDYSPLCDAWRSITVMKHGRWARELGFPEAEAVFRSLPGVRPDEVFFARLPPGAVLKPHSDGNNFLLTASLGLELEEGSSVLSVGDQARAWREGEALVFDHSYVHSAANGSPGRDRYVLGCRFWHPGCSDEEAYTLSFMMAFLERLLRQGRVSAVYEDVWARVDREADEPDDREQGLSDAEPEPCLAGPIIGLWGRLRDY